MPDTDLSKLNIPAFSLPDPDIGLTDAAVEERRAAGLTGEGDTTGVRSVPQIVRAHTLTYFNLLNIFLGALVFSTGQYKHMLFLGIIICNSAIGIIQELRVRRQILKLSVITAARVRVRRGGREVEIPVPEIVQDDIVLLAPGDQIVADGPALRPAHLEVNEALLTGESKPVRKENGALLRSGSFVAAGTSLMRAEKVGRQCYAAGLAHKAQSRKRASSEMVRSIQRVFHIVSVALIPIGLMLYRSQRIAAAAAAQAGGMDAQWIYNNAIVRTVSGMIGMIPEGLVLLTSVSFIIGVGRLAMKGALVQEMQAIESLARADILCTDKTGTITSGELRVSKLMTIGNADKDRIRQICAHMGGASGGLNDTARALERYFGRRHDWTVTEEIPFSSARKYSAAAFAEAGAFVLGAPDRLVPDDGQILSHVKTYTEKGYRCLLLCGSDGISAEEDRIGTLRPLALIIISDVLRDDAKETFAYFENAGVQIKVLSGDDPRTVSAVAQKAGIAGAELAIDAGTLPADLSAEHKRLEECHIYGRVTPEQKQALIRAWQAAGHTVAMVGDGVNDVLAIKDADCGIAMAAGAGAARSAAHIVLTGSDFGSMREIIGEGKTVICNIERVSALYLTKMIYAAVLSVLFSILLQPYPWTTLQMGLINLVGIGMPSFLLALEQHREWKSIGFRRQVVRLSVPTAATMIVTIFMIRLAAIAFGWPQDMTALFSLTLGGLVSLLLVVQISWPLNDWRKLIIGACTGVFLAAILFLPRFYDIHSILTPWSLLMLPFALFISVMLSQFSRLVKKYDTGSDPLS